MATTTTRIELPDEEWAEVRNPKKVPERLRRPVRVAAINLQRSLPEDQRRGIVKLAQEPEQTAEEDTQAAFGVPPVDALVEENKPDENSLTFLPDEDQQSAVDAYNEALIVSVVQSWSFGEVTVDALRDIPGDAFDVLLDHARGGDEEKAKDGTEGSSDSLADDPTAP